MRFSIISIIVLFFNVGCSSLLFYPQREFVDNPLLSEISYEDKYFKTPDGLMLHGWVLYAKNKSNGSILFLHGNAENISTHINSVLWLTLEGYDVFSFDYRGYGRSQGYPTLEGVHIDAHAALETILNLPNINKENIFIFGQSLGGAIAVYTLSASPYKNRINALIIDSAFSGYKLIAREEFAQFILTWPLQYPLSLLIDDSYSPIRWIKQIYPVPILIIHGDQDRIVSIDHSSVLYAEALYPKELLQVKDAGHIQALTLKYAREEFIGFLRKHASLK